MFIETETTPNPATLKFLPGETVMADGTREFTSAEAAAVSPLAEALFTLGDVTGVLFGRDFVAVTIAPGATWGDAGVRSIFQRCAARRTAGDSSSTRVCLGNARSGMMAETEFRRHVLKTL